MNTKRPSIDSNPPTITEVVVTGLIHPDFLLEIDAIAFKPEAGND